MIFPEHSEELYNHINSLWPRDTISSGDMSVNIDSGIGIMPVRHHAITWTNVDLLLIGSLGTKLSEIWIRIQIFSVRKTWFENVFFKTATIVFKPQCVCIYHLSIVTGYSCSLTHWGRATHICVSNLTIIASDNGLSPGQRQAIIWTNAGILLIGPLAINFSEILMEILIFSFKKMYLKLSSVKWRLLRLGLNVLTHWGRDQIDAISQTTFANAFSWMKINEFPLGFHWSLFLRFELTIFQHWFR